MSKHVSISPTEAADRLARGELVMRASISIQVTKVTFPNRLTSMAGSLFVPPNIDKTTKHPALAVAHPFGGVKEQTAGIYASKMAEKGFVTLAFDASRQGESGGYPRDTENPAEKMEDIRCAVDYLTTLNIPPSLIDTNVDRLSRPPALTATLNWWRAANEDLAVPAGCITTPTLYIWGDQDATLGAGAAKRTADYVDANYSFHVLEVKSHWLPEQASDQMLPSSSMISVPAIKAQNQPDGSGRSIPQEWNTENSR